MCLRKPTLGKLSQLRTYSTQAPNGIKLRDYQVDAVNNVLESVDSGIKRPVVVLATGGGKTVVMSHLIPQIQSKDSKRKKTLVLAHKEELVRQTAKTLRAMNPGVTVDIDMSKQKPAPHTDVIVGSVNTLVRLTRLSQYDPSEFKTIVLDECHHAPAQSWTKILNYFGALEPGSDIVVLGFTATLERTDGKALGDVFQKVVYQRNLREMIKGKELCDARFSTMKVDLDLDEVRVKSGDYDQVALAEAVNSADINSQVAKAYTQLRVELGLKSTLVFCVDINHCKTLCGVLQAHGVNAQYVTGDTAKHVRQEILEEFKEGKIDVLCNVLVFTEGTDIPNIDSLILARPTKSRPLLTQMIGRGLRLHRGKDVCHIVDMVNTMKVGVSSVPTLFGLPPGHKVDKKSFAELDSEKEELDTEAKEMETKTREDDVRRIIALQQQVADIKLKFDVINGFASMIEKKGSHLKEHPDQVHEAFRESGYDWVRLEYDIWGLPVTHSDTFLTMERVQKSPDSVEFELYQNSNTNIEMLRASRYKCPRRHKYLLNEGSLEYLLSVASSAVNRRPFQARTEKKVSKKQADYIVSALTKKVKSTYSEDRVAEFTKVVRDMSMHRASNLIFAYKFSVNSLWVKWELKKILGLPPKLQTKIDKVTNKIQSEMETLKLKTDTAKIMSSAKDPLSLGCS